MEGDRGWPRAVTLYSARAVHRFDNNAAGDVKALCLITPAAIGPQFFREAAEVINAAAGGPPDRAKMTEIMIRHGLTPVPHRLRRKAETRCKSKDKASGKINVPRIAWSRPESWPPLFPTENPRVLRAAATRQ